MAAKTKPTKAESKANQDKASETIKIDEKSTLTEGTELSGSTAEEGKSEESNTDSNAEEGEESDTGSNAEEDKSKETGLVTEAAEKEKDADPISTDELNVRLTNNSISGHEMLRSNGKKLDIKGHGNVTFSSTKAEMVVISAQLASKPWIEIHLIDEAE